jgi:hypothetical protein
VKRVRGLDREFAKQSPETVFGHPSALADEVSLTYGEKLATLERWRSFLKAWSLSSVLMATVSALSSARSRAFAPPVWSGDQW